MAYFYVDTDGSGATAPYDTWAKAGQDVITVAAAMSAGDICFIQGAAIDTAAATRAIVTSGTAALPCQFIGVIDGTTNTGASVVVADFASTLPIIQSTGAANDITFLGDSIWQNIEFDSADYIILGSVGSLTDYHNCRIKWIDRVQDGGGFVRLYNCIFEPAATGAVIQLTNKGIEVYGGSWDNTVTATQVHRLSSTGPTFWHGFDFTLAPTVYAAGTGSSNHHKLYKCKIPTSWTIAANVSVDFVEYELIGCSDATSFDAGSSVQNYDYESSNGTVTLSAITRTDGANDQAAGAFAYAMDVYANSTQESIRGLRSPIMAAWITGVASTITIYFQNNAQDFTEDEVWVELFTPPVSDSTLDTFTVLVGAEAAGDQSLQRFLPSSTVLTDDTGSTWSTAKTFQQKVSCTITPGYEGLVYARLYYCKKIAAPDGDDTLYLDPKISIVVT